MNTKFEVTRLFGAMFLCAAVTACGSGDDPVVDSDAGMMDGGNADGGNADGGNADGGNADGGNADGGNADGGGNDGEREGGGPDLPDGTPLVAMAGAAPITGVMPCKLEIFDGTEVTSATAVQGNQSFDPATLSLTMNGVTNLTSGWGYVNQSSEYEAMRTTTGTIGNTNETVAKITHLGEPAFYRNKITQADFSYEQLECYNGLIIE